MPRTLLNSQRPWVRARDPRPVAETLLQRSLVEHLRWTAAPDVAWFAVPNGGARRRTEAAILKGMGVVPGIPDLILVRAGHMFGLELKAETGRLSDDQRAAQAWLIRSGASIATAWGLDAALATLTQWDLLRTAPT